MTRILFVGDMAATGFGTVTRELGLGLLGRGYDVRFVCMNEQSEGLGEPFVGRTAILGNFTGWLGMEDPGETAKKLEGMFTGSLFEDGWKPDAAIILGDPASLKMSPVLDFIPEGFPAFHYCPIEGVGLPPSWVHLWERAMPVAVAESGAHELARLVGHPVPYIYHGVDVETYHPATAAHPIVLTKPDGEMAVLRDKAACRKFLGWPADDVILFRHDRHVPRKQYPALFRIAAAVIAQDPRVRLMIHCRTLDEGGDLSDEHSKYLSRIADRMRSTGYADQRLTVSPKFLSVMLNASDIYVSTCAEGFGLCIAEALACGIPAIGLDYSSVPEVIGPAGVTVPFHLIDNIYSYFWARPDEEAYISALLALIKAPERFVMGAKGPGHVREHFTWDKAAEGFAALIDAAVPQEVAA